MTEKTGRKPLLIKLCIVFFILLAYYIFVRVTGLGIPCVFNKITGLKCPGCGISRMLINLSELKLEQAFENNQVLFCMLPIFAVLLLIKIIFMPKWLESGNKVFSVITISAAVILVAFGIGRNLIPFIIEKLG